MGEVIQFPGNDKDKQPHVDEDQPKDLIQESNEEEAELVDFMRRTTEAGSRPQLPDGVTWGKDSLEPAEHERQLDAKQERIASMQRIAEASGLPGPREMMRTREIMNVIDSLGTINNETLQMRRELVKETSGKDAREILFASSQQDWVKNPAYYKALAERALSPR